MGIVTWNSGEFIGRCLDSLPRACRGLRAEVIVLDNGSSDDTITVVGERPVRLIELGRNIGFAAGVNRLIEEATGRNILLLNPDCVPDPGSIAELVSHLESRPDLAGVVPLLVDHHREPQRDFQLRSLPTFRTLLSEILLLNRLFPANRYSSSHLYREAGIDGQPVLVEQPAGAALLLRASVLEQVGPFDERFEPAWFEDVDYCRRLRDGGYSLELLPTVLVEHRGGSSLTKMDFSEFLTIWYRNLHRYARKWMSRGEAESIRWIIMSGMILRIAALAIGLSRTSGGRKEAIRAHMGVLKEAWREWRP